MQILNNEQLNAVSGGGGAILGVIAVIVFFSSGGYENAVDFTSGAIEGFVNGLE
jgi:bacteriocin-like protein